MDAMGLQYSTCVYIHKGLSHDYARATPSVHTLRMRIMSVIFTTNFFHINNDKNIIDNEQRIHNCTVYGT